VNTSVGGKIIVLTAATTRGSVRGISIIVFQVFPSFDSNMGPLVSWPQTVLLNEPNMYQVELIHAIPFAVPSIPLPVVFETHVLPSMDC
jgi:hypothetical protein